MRTALRLEKAFYSYFNVRVEVNRDNLSETKDSTPPIK